ncbi:MAG: Yip1 family protein [Marinosulfonomonas sp.]
MTLKDYIQNAIATLRNPRAGARHVMAVTMERQDRWLVLALMVILNTIIAEIFLLLMGAQDAAMFPIPALNSPLVLSFVQVGAMFLLAIGIDVVGRRFKGTGTLDQAILLIAWLQFIMICIQVVQLVIFAVAPPIGALVSLISLIIMAWLLTVFVAELHGFQSLGVVFLCIIAGIFTFSIGVAILLALLGFQITV